MQPIEIVTIILAVLIVAGVAVGTAIKKKNNKKKGLPGGCCDCAGCPYCEACKRHASQQKTPIGENKREAI